MPSYKQSQATENEDQEGSLHRHFGGKENAVSQHSFLKIILGSKPEALRMLGQTKTVELYP